MPRGGVLPGDQHMTAKPECVGWRVDDAMPGITRGNERGMWRPRPRVTMAELLARFDPVKQGHELTFDGDPMGKEAL